MLLAAAPAVFQPRGGPSNPKRWHHKKSGAEHSIQRHSSSPTGLSGGCAKPIFDHAHERSAKRQGERGLILCPLSSNLPYRSRRVELRLQQRRKTEEAGFELSVPRESVRPSRPKSLRGTKENTTTFSGCRKPVRSKACNQHARSYTVNVKIVGLTGALVAFMASPAGAQSLTVEKARAIVSPFYEALNRPAEKDVVRLLE